MGLSPLPQELKVGQTVGQILSNGCIRNNQQGLAKNVAKLVDFLKRTGAHIALNFDVCLKGWQVEVGNVLLMVGQVKNGRFILKTNVVALEVECNCDLVARTHCYPPTFDHYKPVVGAKSLFLGAGKQYGAPTTVHLARAKMFGRHRSDRATIAFDNPVQSVFVGVRVIFDRQLAEPLSAEVMNEFAAVGSQDRRACIPDKRSTATAFGLFCDDPVRAHSNDIAAGTSAMPVVVGIPPMRKGENCHIAESSPRQISDARAGGNGKRSLRCFAEAIAAPTTPDAPIQKVALRNNRCFAATAKAAPALAVLGITVRQAKYREFAKLPSSQVDAAAWIVIRQPMRHAAHSKENAAARACVICQDNTACGRRNTQYSTGACCLGASIIAQMGGQYKERQLVYRP